MKKITISFTAEELLELCRQLDLVTHLLFHYDDYPNKDLVHNMEQKLCMLGYNHCNENNDYIYDDRFTEFFGLSNPQNEELEVISKAAENQLILEYLEDFLAFRDLQDRHGKLDPDHVVHDQALLDEYEGYKQKYKMELLLNGVENLRLFKMPTN